MSFGPQKPRRPADVPMEQWIMQQAAKAADLHAIGKVRKANEILMDLAVEAAYGSTGRSFNGNPCAEIVLPTRGHALLDEVGR